MITFAEGGNGDGSNNFLQQAADLHGIQLGAPVAPPTTQSSKDFPFVYRGNHIGYVTRGGFTPPSEPDLFPHRGRNDKDFRASVLGQQFKFEDSSTEEKRHMALLLALAGFAGPSVYDTKKAVEWSKTASLDDILQTHLDFLQSAANAYGASLNTNRKKLTPKAFLKMRLDFRFNGKWNGDLDSLTADTLVHLPGGEGLAPKKLFTGTKTTKETSTDYLDPQDVKYMIRGLLQQELGRDPTQAEYEDFLSAANAAQHANPSTRTTTSHIKNGELVSQDTVTHAGISQNGLAQQAYEDLKKRPEWGEWQAVGTYAPALFEALGATVSGV